MSDEILKIFLEEQPELIDGDDTLHYEYVRTVLIFPPGRVGSVLWKSRLTSYGTVQLKLWLLLYRTVRSKPYIPQQLWLILHCSAFFFFSSYFTSVQLFGFAT